MTIHLKTPDLTELNPKIAVFGVGGAGGNAVNNMIAAKLQGVSFVVANTDAQALIHSQADTIIQLGANMTEGLGAGSKPEIGAAAAEESIDEIRTHLRGLHMVFITAGMGGGTGTGAAPVIAAVAREEGVLTVGVVTKPFHFEGQRRMRSAEFGIELLSEQVDTLIVIPNQNLFRVAVMKTTFSEAFAMADQVLHDGISCITDVMVKEGIINLDFADVNLIMRGSGKAMMGTGDASGENRGREAAEAAITNPLLDDVSLQGAKGLLVSIIGGSSDLTLYEVDEAANRVREEIASDANIIIGTAFDETLNGSIRVSVVATGLDEKAQMVAPASPATNKAPEPAVEDQSLTQRLGQINAANMDMASQPGQKVIAAEQSEAFGLSMPQAAPPVETVGMLSASPGLSTQAGFAEQTVRMPTIDDFPPMGQALLRGQRGQAMAAGQGVPPEVAAPGIETHKQRVGFFERLAGLAGGRRAFGGSSKTVAEQPHINVQSPMGRSQSQGAFLDPHVKGEALSPHQSAPPQHSIDKEEVSEFPAFLRK